MGVLDGQVAVVTGGGRGIGRGIAHELAAEGAAVVIDDVFRGDSGFAAEAVAAEIEATGGQALGLHEDITVADGGRALVEQSLARFGKIDILVLCAGNYLTGPLHEMTDQQWDATMNLHLRGHFVPTRAVLPHMLERNTGRIVMVASRGAFFQVPPHKQVARDAAAAAAGPNAAYSAAKAGILGLATTLAFETWDTGITVNTLLPSATTQLFPGTSPRMVGGAPPTSSLDPGDVAPAVAFLCSPVAANISGKIMYAAGGDVVFFGEQLSMTGSRMVRKAGRWTQPELAEVLPPLLGVPVAEPSLV
ncbi:SDR family NAD(P)-dependent oxidoreductase [Amycolatopsis jejuensis]|uniref:SDR family NAD(P)-dependent oxidoreductase n=1 Tax=Amycolatopsis jejuensis TaxID=330084 RepID=UPI00068BBA9E|nr:SDR family oxidoreductase [Amycolatopsis jejuensis]